MPRHTYLQTNIYIYIYIYIKCVHRSNPLGPNVIQKLYSWHFSHYTLWEKRCSQEEFRPCYSQSQVVHSYHVLTLPLQGFVGQKFHFWPDMKTKIGVVISMYLKHSLHYIYSTYIWVHGSNSQGSSFMAEVPFLAF